MERTVLFVASTDALVAKAPGTKSEAGSSPPAIIHRGISAEQLRGLTGCVRTVTPNPFSLPFESWTGKEVKFVLRGRSDRTICVVNRVIESIVLKPLEAIGPNDLEGTMAQIAMQELHIPFRQFFREVYGSQRDAMIIRVHG